MTDSRQAPIQPDIPDFALIRLIGAGSYGDVWLARSVTGAFRAVKVVYRNRFESDRAFEREFRGIQACEPISRAHPNLVQLLHVGRNSIAGFYFYVMELADDISGEALTDPDTYTPRTVRTVLRTTKPGLPEAAAIVEQLSGGLAHLHKHALVHRDIKPSNIIFVGGVPKLGDIGLVAPSREAMSFVGTEGYVPPEGMGRPQADVYSLGKVLYELATGMDRLDFPALSPDATAPPDRDGAPFGRLNTIILRACAPDLRRRFPSADALKDALRGFSRSTAHPGPPPIGRGTTWMLRAAVVALMGVVLVVLWVLIQTKRQPAPATPMIESPVAAPTHAPAPISAADESRDAVASPIPTKTVTEDGTGEFFHQ